MLTFKLRAFCLPGFFRRCKVQDLGAGMTLRYLLLSPFSLDNSQEGNVFRVKRVGSSLQRQDNGIQDKSQAFACSPGKIR